ncbi:hypothetical protein [Riemerella anatipestifer]|uniref:hypothetical protein n=1 Tax=Riemerella anatipestifer TaxID=34085 RepID=UPI00129D8F34|nr:hypothetical protein [Riemerella anatipestifer]MBT0550473.1 hypothetical protein [Riemerella anatipestifer]MBT0553416.1 hypothetical protein [Riemerella anatipestifer]MCE3023418.1 hypothetical protein [Riemerella anatipestifer]MCU7542374.1 hypothetical protein [Riemerella anatipestifer]MCU7559246.1 hypothetical protein [Riemerella anatipestifer]
MKKKGFLLTILILLSVTSCKDNVKKDDEDTSSISAVFSEERKPLGETLFEPFIGKGVDINPETKEYSIQGFLAKEITTSPNKDTLFVKDQFNNITKYYYDEENLLSRKDYSGSIFLLYDGKWLFPHLYEQKYKPKNNDISAKKYDVKIK